MPYDPAQYPYDTVVYITTSIGGEVLQGSGVLLTPDEVLTAAHVVYNPSIGSTSSITVSPGYSEGASSFGTYYGSTYRYNPISDANGRIDNYNSQLDFAVIHLSRPVIAASYMLIQPDFGGGSVNVTGYPASAGGLQFNSTQTVSVDPTYSIIDFNALGEGSSGGPLWFESPDGPRVVGVVSAASGVQGYAGLITSSIYHEIQAWIATDERTSTVPDYVASNSRAVAVFRFFDTSDGGHFFTTSVTEFDQVEATRPTLRSEGIGFGAVSPAYADPAAAPVYRFFDTEDGGHFFTASATERDTVLMSRPDLQFEGVGYDEHTTQQAGDVAVYRFFDTVDGGHFFTASDAEKNTVMATNAALHYEGIAFYAPALS